VVPPTLIPREAGSRVKTDRRDSRKLAFLLSRGFLKRVWVPSQEERFDREVIRQRHRLVQDRRRLQCQLKALLHLYGLTIAVRPGRWSEEYIQRLWQVHLGHERSQESYLRLLERHDFVSRQLRDQTALVRDLATGERYDKSVRLLCAIPGIGVITAMELLTELGDLRRFGRADRLAVCRPAHSTAGGLKHRRLGSRWWRSEAHGRGDRTELEARRALHLRSRQGAVAARCCRAQ
jgi:transposase